MTLEEIIPAFFLLALGAWAVTLPLSMFWSIRQKSKLKPKPLYHRLYLRTSPSGLRLWGFIYGGLPAVRRTGAGVPVPGLSRPSRKRRRVDERRQPSVMRSTSCRGCGRFSGLITAVGAAFLVGWRAKSRERMTTAITSLETGVVGKIQRLREDLSGSIAELRTQVAVIDQHRQTGSLETVALRSEMAAMQHEVGDIAKSVVKPRPSAIPKGRSARSPRRSVMDIATISTSSSPSADLCGRLLLSAGEGGQGSDEARDSGRYGTPSRTPSIRPTSIIVSRGAEG